MICNGLLPSLVAPGETLWGSGPAALLPRTPRLNRGCGLSLDNARVRVPGGGGNIGAEEGSGDGLWICAGDPRSAGDASSGDTVAGRLLRGGEYGGGAGADHEFN